MRERTPKERLYWLLDLYKNNKINTNEFCSEFHVTYDHDLDYEDLTSIEDELFEDLSRSASRFSERDEDHILYPNVYSTEYEVRSKIQRILTELIS